MENKSPTVPSSAEPVRLLRFQSAANRTVRILLRTPVVCRFVGRLLLTVYVVGRKSGTRYIVPVAYATDARELLIATPFGWARNLRTGTPVEIRLKGRLRQADVRVVTDELGVVEVLAIMARGNRNFASFNRIGIGRDGEPDPADLHRVWATGARAFRLTLAEARPRTPAADD